MNFLKKYLRLAFANKIPLKNVVPSIVNAMDKLFICFEEVDGKFIILEDTVNQKTKTIFGSVDLADDLESYVLAKGKLVSAEKKNLLTILKEMIADKKIERFENRIVVAHGGITRRLSCTWNSFTSEDDRRLLLLTADDITNKSFVLENNGVVEIKTTEQLMFRELSKSNKKKALAFLRHASFEIERNIQSAAGSVRTKRDLNDHLGFIHTLKARSIDLGLEILAENCHKAEGEIQTYILHRQKHDLEYFHSVRDILQKYEDVIREEMTWLMDEGKVADVPVEGIRSFVDSWPALLPFFRREMTVTPDESDVLSFFYLDLGSIPKELESLSRWASQEDEYWPMVNVKPGRVWVKSDFAQTLKEVFYHLYTNSKEHGIEPAEERIRSGKPQRGQCQIDYSKNRDGDVLIHWYDDGRGFNPQDIQVKAIAAGITSTINATPSEIAQCFMAPEWSSKPSVGALSGRGIGLYEVSQKIESIGGKFSTTAELQLSATHFRPVFTFSIPKSAVRYEKVVGTARR